MVGLPPRQVLRNMSPSYLGVVLCIAQLHKEGTDGIAWPQRHSRGYLSLMKRLNPAARKSPQNLLTHQPPLQQSPDDLQQGL
jgi:hypothetical protein